MPYLKVMTGKDKDKVHKIVSDTVTFGRDPNETIQVLDQGVSRQHSEIFRIGELYFIRDLDSKNGTILNEEKVTEQALQSGDKIRVGDTVFVFEDEMEAEARPVSDKVQFTKEDLLPASTIEINLRHVPGAEEGATHEGRNLQVLSKVARICGNTHNLKAIYEKALKLAMEAVGADNGYIFEKGARGSLIPAMVIEKETDKSSKVSKSIISRVMEHEKALLTADAAVDPRFSGRDSVILRKTSSVLCAPLVALETINGVIYLSASRFNKTFNSDDLEIVSVIAIQLGMALQAVRAMKKEKDNLIAAVKALVGIKEQRNPLRKGHSSRVANYCAAVGREMKMLSERIYYLQLSAWLHDIGNIFAEDDAKELTLESMSGEARKHRQIERIQSARKIIETIGFDKEVVGGVVHHTERFDGKGFPDGMMGPDIPVFARIISVAKEFDHLCSYGGADGQGMQIKDALVSINKRAAADFDPEVVQALLVSYRKGSLLRPEEQTVAK